MWCIDRVRQCQCRPIYVVTWVILHSYYLHCNASTGRCRTIHGKCIELCAAVVLAAWVEWEPMCRIVFSDMGGEARKGDRRVPLSLEMVYDATDGGTRSHREIGILYWWKSLPRRPVAKTRTNEIERDIMRISSDGRPRMKHIAQYWPDACGAAAA